jgi:hypothetical protein
MNATARKTRAAADAESPSDELDLSDLLDAVASGNDTDLPIDDTRTRESEARTLRGESRGRPGPGPQSSTKLDLIAESRRIREECNDFVRRYQEAIGARRSPRPRAPEGRDASAARERGSDHDAAWRRKALLHLLIEELV